MSQSPLAAELHQLRVELAHLSSRVLALEEAALRERVGPTPYGSPLTVNYLGTNQLPEIPPFPLASPSTLPTSRTSSQRLADSPGASSAPLVTEADRRRIAEEAGAFLRRSLDGDHRGGSGRSRVPLPSTVYILARDINGVCYDPVKIFYNWSSLRHLVKNQSSCQDSVFIGLPTIWEAKICVASARLSWPDE